MKPFDAGTDYYKILGVGELASAQDLRKSWKKMMLTYHAARAETPARWVLTAPAFQRWA